MRMLFTIVTVLVIAVAGCTDSATTTTTTTSTTTTTPPSTTTTTVAETTTTAAPTTTTTTVPPTTTTSTTTTTTTTVPPVGEVELNVTPDGFSSQNPPFEMSLITVSLTGFENASVQSIVTEQINAELAARSGEMLTDFVETYDPDLGDVPTSDYIVDIPVFNGSHGIVSLLVHEAIYHQGAANYNDVYYSQNFDAETGAELVLADGLISGGVGEVAGAVEEWIRDNLWTDDLHDQYVPADLVPLLDAWFVTAEGLGFGFDKYEIGPGALGPVSVVIPWDRIASVVAPDGFLAPFVTG